jgi:hypothetical protein
MSFNEPREIAKAWMDKPEAFGQQQNDLSKWMRDKVLICTDQHYNMDTGKVKTWLLSKAGMDEIRAILLNSGWTSTKKPVQEETRRVITPNTILYPSVLQVSEEDRAAFDREVTIAWVKRVYQTDLASLHFDYKEKSDRLWHPLQWVKADVRDEVLRDAGLTYSYDIQACAPTLIHQWAQRQPDPMDEWLPAIQSYLADRVTFRQHVMKVGEIDEKQAKVIINALFCGAKLGANRDFSLYHVVDQDWHRMMRLRLDPLITELRENIKTCWDAIEPGLPRVEVMSKKTGKMRKMALNSKRKWGVYFDLERRVLVVVRDYLKAGSNAHFLIHDGWSTQRPVDAQDLQEVIYQKTGFSVIIKEVEGE